VGVTILSTMLSDHEGVGEWGFAALVEVDGRPFLFDTGARPETVLRNAEELGVDLSRVTDVVLSHHHEDHTGGLVTLRRALMRKNPDALSRAHVAPAIFWSRPEPSGEANAMIATKRAYEALGGTFVEHRAFDQLAPGVFLSGPVSRVFPEKNFTGTRIVVGPNGEAPDEIPEDMALLIETKRGIVAVFGCGHAGVVNTLSQARAEIHEPRVLAIIGGIHLFDASDATLDWTAKQLAPMHPSYVVGAHCTGIEATYRLRAALGLSRRTAVVGAVGARFDLASGVRPGAIAR